MKYLLIIAMLASSSTLVDTQDLKAISSAISKGDAVTLSKYFDEDVEIAILDSEDIYSKGEAQGVIKSFFGKHKPKTYSQVHKGESEGKTSQYSIGNLKTSNGTFRVYIYLKVQGSKHLIQELRIDKE